MSKVRIKTRTAKEGESQRLVDIKHINALKIERNKKKHGSEIHKSYQSVIDTLTAQYNKKYNTNI